MVASWSCDVAATSPRPGPATSDFDASTTSPLKAQPHGRRHAVTTAIDGWSPASLTTRCVVDYEVVAETRCSAFHRHDVTPQVCELRKERSHPSPPQLTARRSESPLRAVRAECSGVHSPAELPPWAAIAMSEMPVKHALCCKSFHLG